MHKKYKLKGINYKKFSTDMNWPIDNNREFRLRYGT